MTDFSSRQSFINHSSEVLLRRLCEKFQKEELSNIGVFQPAKSNFNHKGCDFVIPSSIVAHLSKSCFNVGNLEEFTGTLEESLTWLIQESKQWRISIVEWSKLKGSYGVTLDRRKLFRVVLRNFIEHRGEGTTSSPSPYQDSMMLCHVNDVPTLDDIRTLCYCSILAAQLKSSLFISVDNTTDVSQYNNLVDELDLRLNVVNSSATKSMPSTLPTEKYHKEFSHLVIKHSPSYFHELLRQESNPSYPLLKKIATLPRFKTATESKILCEQKNMSCNMARNAMKVQKSPGSSSSLCIHVCSQRKLLLAQQSELYYVWSRELLYQHFQFKDAEENTSMENGCDRYLVHSSVSDSEATAACFLKLRHKQIVESFESKHQVKVKGEQWKDIISKMKASLIKLEFLKAAATTHLKTSWENNTLPSDATFILYNYSRLSTIMKNFQSEVSKGVYSPLPLIEDLDFSVLTEETEWSLLIPLWIFQDVIRKPAVLLDYTTVEINCHRLISYLQNLCRSTSTFYSRHHILGGNLPHLLPLMHCRLYLIKAILLVMKKVFDILGIVPLEQM